MVLVAEDGGYFGSKTKPIAYKVSGKCWVNNHAHVLKAKESVDTDYLCYSLMFYNVDKIVNGATRQKLNQKQLRQMLVPKRTKSKQLEIVRQLKTIERIIENKGAQLTDYDQLIKSRFVEMFGELKETVLLGECCKVHARIGWQALTKAEHMQTGDYLLITGTDFKDNEVNYFSCKYVTKDRYEMDKNIILKNDDVLITKDGTIGKVAIVHNLPKPATLNSGVFVVRPDERFNKEYISYVF